MQVLTEINLAELLSKKTDPLPQIIARGSMEQLLLEEVLVLFEGKAVVCNTILEAVDLSFKAFYVFNFKFNDASSAAWQFLDYAVYKMKTTTTVLSGVKELAAYAAAD
jgi:hypothetical protein